MGNKILIVLAGSNFEGGAELQLNKILKNISKYEIYLFCFAKSNEDLGAYSSLKKFKKFHFYALNTKKLLYSLKNIIDIFDIIKTSQDKITILGWLAKGNLIALIFGILKPFKTKLFLCHRSRFTLNQSFQSQILIYLTLIINYIYPKKVIHIANSPIIYSSKIIRFLLKNKPICIKNCFNFNKNETSIKKIPKKIKSLNLTIVGRFSREKGYELLFKSLSKVNFNYSLLCIGNGCSHKNQKFKLLCRKYNIKAKAYEKINNINKVYIGSDFLVSASYSEAFPNVVVESLLNGTPVISTPTGPFLNLLKEFNLVSESFRSNDLSKVLEESYFLRNNNNNTYQSISKKLRAKIIREILTPRKAAENYEEVFENN